MLTKTICKNRNTTFAQNIGRAKEAANTWEDQMQNTSIKENRTLKPNLALHIKKSNIL